MSEEATPTPLVLVRGEATEEEVAALVAVIQGISAAASLASASEEPENVSAWAAPVRKLRASHPHGPGGWRASALPR